jgi:hypothetical protein
VSMRAFARNRRERGSIRAGGREIRIEGERRA